MNTNKQLWYYLATWFGCGRAPFASGTVGSFAALPFAWLIQYFLGYSGLFFAAWLMFFAGLWASEQFIRHMNKGSDPKEVVIDEVSGQWLTLCIVPPSLIGYALGFLVFRIFDVFKPWPVSWADRKLHGGMGIMLDDMLAGMYSMMVMALLMHYFGFLYV